MVSGAGSTVSGSESCGASPPLESIIEAETAMAPANSAEIAISHKIIEVPLRFIPNSNTDAEAAVGGVSSCAQRCDLPQCGACQVHRPPRWDEPRVTAVAMHRDARAGAPGRPRLRLRQPEHRSPRVPSHQTHVADGVSVFKCVRDPTWGRGLRRRQRSPTATFAIPPPPRRPASRGRRGCPAPVRIGLRAAWRAEQGCERGRRARRRLRGSWCGRSRRP